MVVVEVMIRVVIDGVQSVARWWLLKWLYEWWLTIIVVAK
jgi:hypothetical protein